MTSRADLTKTRYPGVFRRKDGVFVVRVAVRVDGKLRYRMRTMHAGAKAEDAVRTAAQLREQLRARKPTPGPPLPGTSRATSTRTVEDYAQEWLNLKQARLRPSAYRMYKDAMKKRVLPRIGFLAVEALCRSAVEAWVAWAESQRKPDGKPYTQPTLRSWWRVLAAMLRDLSADLDLPDPTRRVRPPESNAPPVREQQTLTKEQLQAFLDAVQQYRPDRYAEVAVLAYTGMRAGEAYGLKWDAVEFQAGHIEIRRSVSRGELVESTKTKAPRVVPLHPHLAAILQDHRREQLKTQHRGLSTGLVFPTARGEVRTAQSLTKVFVLASDAAGLGIRVTPQVLRRTFDTLMVLAGVDRITLRAMMGHTSEEMTERYAGIPLAAKRAALDSIFG